MARRPGLLGEPHPPPPRSAAPLALSVVLILCGVLALGPGRRRPGQAGGGQRLRGGSTCRFTGRRQTLPGSRSLSPAGAPRALTLTHLGGGFKETRKSLPTLAVRARARPSEAPPSGREKGTQTKAPGWPCIPEKDEVPGFICLFCGDGVGAGGGGESSPILMDPS